VAITAFLNNHAFGRIKKPLPESGILTGGTIRGERVEVPVNEYQGDHT
jgi:hypothetical protein